MATTICEICQKEFVKHNGKQIYCTQDCYKEARRRQHHTPEQRARKARNKRDQRARNPESNREACKQYRERYPDKVKERNQAWYEKNPDYRREYTRKYREENPNRALEHARYYQNHKEEVAARVNARRKAHPELQQDKNSRRRARLLQAVGEWTCEEFKALCEAVDFHCAYCHQHFDKLTPDHIIPLSRGGSNDITNIIPACRACNYSKQDKTPLEYISRFNIFNRA